MKYLHLTGVVVLLFASPVMQAQNRVNGSKTEIQDKKQDKVAQSEAKKNEYKSKEWHQGMEVIRDDKKESPVEPKAGMGKKPAKQSTPGSTSPLRPPANN